MQDGRINPTRIEETVAKCESELQTNIEEMGQQAILEFGFRNVHPEIIKLLGSLYFRTSYTQNNLVHSKEVALFCRMIADELGLDGLCPQPVVSERFAGDSKRSVGNLASPSLIYSLDLQPLHTKTHGQNGNDETDGHEPAGCGASAGVS